MTSASATEPEDSRKRFAALVLAPIVILCRARRSVFPVRFAHPNRMRASTNDRKRTIGTGRMPVSPKKQAKNVITLNAAEITPDSTSRAPPERAVLLRRRISAAMQVTANAAT